MRAWVLLKKRAPRTSKGMLELSFMSDINCGRPLWHSDCFHVRNRFFMSLGCKLYGNCLGCVIFFWYIMYELHIYTWSFLNVTFLGPCIFHLLKDLLMNLQERDLKATSFLNSTPSYWSMAHFWWWGATLSEIGFTLYQSEQRLCQRELTLPSDAFSYRLSWELLSWLNLMRVTNWVKMDKFRERPPFEWVY